MVYRCEYCGSVIPYGQEVMIGNMYCHLQCAIDQAKSDMRIYQSSLLQKPNVIGIGIGWRHKRYFGFDRKEVCVVVNVIKRVSEDRLTSAQIVPKWLRVTKTDVLETHEIVAPRPISVAGYYRRSKVRPAKGGVSIGHIRVTAGTLGCLVRRGYEVLILSNNHVLANENEDHLDDPILQPRPVDGGRYPDDVLARLDHYIPIAFGYDTNYVDAAIARPISNTAVSSEVLGIGTPTGTVAPSLGMKVVKSGRTTGITRGEIVQIATTVRIRYRRGMALFTSQFLIHPGHFSKGGDSGSVVFVDDETRRICGLLFAGSDVVSASNSINSVLNKLRVTLS